MINYIVIHNKHEGCYDFECYEDEETRMRLTSITINPPKIFLFTEKAQAQMFFEEYMNDIDVLDPRCKNGEEVEHLDYCTCGIIELDEEDNPILFYNKKNQVFLLENGPRVFIPAQEVKNDMLNLNLTNSLMRRCKKLSKEQRSRYIELGKHCEECSTSKKDDSKKDDSKNDDSKNDDSKNDDSKNDDSKNDDSKKVASKKVVSKKVASKKVTSNKDIQIESSSDTD